MNTLEEPSDSGCFLDYFYDLSCVDNSDRSKAAHGIICHCLFPVKETGSKDDALYTLGRLLKGLNSSRESSREGFSSCLTMFLKIAFSTLSEVELKELLNQDDNKNIHEVIFEMYMKETTMSKGCGNERDYIYGRIFGFYAIVRSDMLKKVERRILQLYLEVLIKLCDKNQFLREACIKGMILFIRTISKKEVDYFLFILKKFVSEQDGDEDADIICLKLFLARQSSSKPLDNINVQRWKKEEFMDRTSNETIWYELLQRFENPSSVKEKKEIITFIFSLVKEFCHSHMHKKWALDILRDYVPRLSVDLMKTLFEDGCILKEFLIFMILDEKNASLKEGAVIIWNEICSKLISGQAIQLYKEASKVVLKRRNIHQVECLENLLLEHFQNNFDTQLEYIIFIQELYFKEAISNKLYYIDLLYKSFCTFKTGKKLKLFEIMANFYFDQAFRKDVSLDVEIRKVCSARFYSLVQQAIFESCYQNHQKLTEQHSQLDSSYVYLEHVYNYWRSQSSKVQIMAKYSDTLSKLNLLRDKIYQIQESTQVMSQKKFVKACHSLIMTLQFQLLDCTTDMDEDEDAEYELEEIDTLIIDISHVVEQILGILNDATENDDNDDGSSSSNSTTNNNPLVLLADICVTVLSFFNCDSFHAYKGSSAKLFQKIIKMTWMSCLSVVASASNILSPLILDCNVMSILLDPICVISDTIKEDRNTCSDDEDVSQNFTIFDEEEVESNYDEAEEGKEKKINNHLNNSQEDNKDVEIDEVKLQSLLEETFSEDDDDDILVHHEGADGALATLIQMKQDARKKALQQKQYEEISHSMRCFVLLESLFDLNTFKPITLDAILLLVKPLLVQRRLTEIQLEKENSDNKLSKMKKTMLERTTNVLFKISKSKIISSSITTKTNPKLDDSVLDIIQEVKKKSSSTHAACCSACIFLLSKLPSFQNNLQIFQLELSKLVTECFKKKSTNIRISFFEGLYKRNSNFARITLLEDYIKACTNARSCYLKIVAIDFLGLLYTTKPCILDNDPLQKEALKTLQLSVDKVASALVTTLQLKELNAKKVRQVLKTLKHVVDFVVPNEKEDVPNAFWIICKQIQKELHVIADTSTSHGIKVQCTNLDELMLKHCDIVEEKSKSRPKARKIKSKKTKKKD